MFVYKIILYDSYFYYGMAEDVEDRIQRHLKDLSKNKHHNIIMQRIWNKYHDFKYEILFEGLSREEASKKEKELIKTEPCINIAKGGDGGDTISNHPNKNEIVTKLSVNHNTTYSEEWKNQQGNIAKYGDIIWGIYVCPKCTKEIKGKSNFLRYHGENGEKCGIKEKIVCPHCGKIGSQKPSMVYRHFDNCKFKIK